MEIKEITSDEASLYKSFFSRGLRGDENNFRISVNDDKDAPFPTKGQPDSFTLGAFLENELAGVVSFERDGQTREKLRHKGTLFRMFVASEFRGRSISRKLIEAVTDRVRKLGDIEQINLTVIAGNEKAKNLYSSAGFETFSTERNAIKWKGQYFTEEQMVLFL